jgi:hypothetical protein
MSNGSDAADLLKLHQKIDRSYEIRRRLCLWPCKVLGCDRTKMFHVKHFGTILQQRAMSKTLLKTTVLARGGAIA